MALIMMGTNHASSFRTLSQFVAIQAAKARPPAEMYSAKEQPEYLLPTPHLVNAGINVVPRCELCATRRFHLRSSLRIVEIAKP